MKGATCASLMVLGVFVLFLGVASGALTCYGDEEKCADDECCIQVGNTPVGICRKMHVEDELCEMNPLTNLIKKHVYKVRCPCVEGLKCVAKDGIVGKLAGTCQLDAGEEPETE